MRHYERRLPHWDTVDQPSVCHVSSHGSLPAHRVFLPDNLARSGKAFGAMDRLLDRGARGPLFLHRPALAEMVAVALHDGEQRFHQYLLHASVVTAYRANEPLGGHGQAFWQDESHDYLVRSGVQFYCIQSYSEENPVKAGLGG